MIIYDLLNAPHQYYFESQRNYHEVKDRFLRNTLMALDHLYRMNAMTITYIDEGNTKTLDVLDALVADEQNTISIVYSERKNYYRPSTNTIGFYDTHGLVFRKNHRKRWFEKNKGYNSPMAVLAHELLHCYNELFETEEYHARKKNRSSRKKKIDQAGKDMSYPNLEEQFVIKMTNQIAKRLGEDKRSNYGRSYYEVETVTSTLKKGKKKNGRLLRMFMRKRARHKKEV